MIPSTPIALKSTLLVRLLPDEDPEQARRVAVLSWSGCCAAPIGWSAGR